ncbi:hypothetical protein OG616_22230 [Streptomyces antibioticus]|uniref:hypothetical protein n=1 Tax=Streptomyces antibioticus TaxID=1890 RepID=UPI0022549BFB|nr:hypothetical protein [Streptomyces antibioticus]MCX5170713.1 hypothetical protein [Streptomyces antibioticus]
MAACEPTADRFMDLTVPEYAYMFGFLQADGHLRQGAGNKGRLSVEINVRDLDLLRAFQRLTPYNSSITERIRSTNFAERSHTAIWTLCSLEARTTINRLGLPYGRKSMTISPPECAFSRRDYLRGVVDADGSVGHTGQGWPFVSENAQKLAADLYYDGCLSLDRKKAAADTLKTWVRPVGMRVAPPRRRWTAWEDRVLLRLNDDAAAAKELGRTRKSCAIRLWRLRNGQAPMPSAR